MTADEFIATVTGSAASTQARALAFTYMVGYVSSGMQYGLTSSYEELAAEMVKAAALHGEVLGAVAA